MSLQRLAALVCGIIVEVETAGMERHLSVLLPIISDHILPEKYDLVCILPSLFSGHHTGCYYLSKVCPEISFSFEARALHY